VNLYEWHPIAVHFPLALDVTAAFALAAARSGALERHRTALATFGTWNLMLGAIGVLFAFGTGLAAVADLDLDLPAKAAVALHVKWAAFSGVALLLLAVWRGAGNAADSRPSRLFLVVLWATTAALIVTGYRGGQNVYQFGVGVAHAASQSGASPARGSE
jgi:uncharacterized membrane protein